MPFGFRRWDVGAASACLLGGWIAFAGCGREKGSSLSLQLRPDATCAGVPLGCVNRLEVALEADALEQPKTWSFGFQVPGGQASLDGLPSSGTGWFRVTGHSTSNAIAFSGTSAAVGFTARDQSVDVNVACVLPSPCAGSPTPPFFGNGQDAAVQLGQSNFTRCDQRDNTGTELELSEPEGILADYAADTLWVSARSDNRVAAFVGVAAIASGVDASFVVCQSSTGNTGNTGSDDDRCRRPIGLALLPDGLVLADSENHRAPVFDPRPTANNPASAAALGQPSNSTANDANQGGGPAANTLSFPWGAASEGDTALFVADRDNHRVLRYDAAALANDLSANLVVGQNDFTSNLPNDGGPSASTLSSPAHVATDGVRLYVADMANHRVLVWLDLAGLANGRPADLVLGQPDFTTVTPNTAGVSAASMNAPRGVAATPERLVVADSDNHRVLIWQPPPTANGEPATQVLGQPDFTTNTPNVGQSGSDCGNVGTCTLGQEPPSAATLARPGAVSLVGDRLWVADTCNHRALLYEAMQ